MRKFRSNRRNVVPLRGKRRTWVDDVNEKYSEWYNQERNREDFPLINIADWEGESPPRRNWVAENRIPCGVVTGLYGDGGVGKTILLLQLAVCVVLGIDWLGAKTIAGPVLLMCCEDDFNELWRRLAKIAAYYETDFATLKESGFHIATFAGKDATLAFPDQGMMQESELFTALQKKAKLLRPRLIGIDNLADVFSGDEIRRTQARQFVTKLTGIALECCCGDIFNSDSGTGLVVTAHPSLTGLNTGTGTSGSTGWNNAFRSRMYLRKGEEEEDANGLIDNDYRELETMKANYAAKGEVVRLHWNDGVFVPEDKKNEIDPSVIKRAKEEEFLMQLDEFTKQGRHVSHSSQAGNFAPKMFALGSKKNSSRRCALEEAMDRLFKQQRIYIESYGPKSKRWTRIARTPSGNDD